MLNVVNTHPHELSIAPQCLQVYKIWGTPVLPISSVLNIQHRSPWPICVTAFLFLPRYCFCLSSFRLRLPIDLYLSCVVLLSTGKWLVSYSVLFSSWYNIKQTRFSQRLVMDPPIANLIVRMLQVAEERLNLWVFVWPLNPQLQGQRPDLETHVQIIWALRSTRGGRYDS